jgi:hypothetical protein
MKRKSKSRVLHLTLERRYFAEIVEGTKHVEYRNNVSFWKPRLEGKKFDVIHFRNGYLRNAPEMDVECRGIRLVGKGRAAEYQIKLGRVSNLKRCGDMVNGQSMSPQHLALKIRKLRARQSATRSLEKLLLERDGRDWNRGRYSSQKEHWICWLSTKSNKVSARTIYNRINCPPMLLWLGESAGVPKKVVAQAKKAAVLGRRNFTSQSSAIRNVVSWDTIESCLMAKGRAE